MDASKLKNIILVVLLAVNLVFAVLLSSIRRDALEAEKSMQKSMEEFYALHGIELSSSVDVSAEAPAEYILARSESSELEAVKKLLGKTTAYDQGGNVWFYKSSGGEACFRGTGEMEIIFSGPSWALDGSAEAAAKKCAEKLGMDPVVRSVDGGDLTVVELGWRFQGSEVFNSRIELSFSQKSLLMAVGQRCFDEVVGPSGAETKNCAEVLADFISLVQADGRDCSIVSAAVGGYMISVPVSGEARLTPVWKLETDAGDFFINAVTGREEQLVQ